MVWDSLAVLLSAATLANPQQTPGAMTSWEPTWSPHGRWIAYASDRDGRFGIWRTDGRHVEQVRDSGAQPAWSPDGRRLAFVQLDRLGTAGIAVLPLPRGRVRTIAPSPAFGASWSPDSSQIAYAGDGGEGIGTSVFVVRSDGSHRRKLVESVDEQTDYIDPAWSPDGKRIAYTSPGGQSIVIADTVGGGYSVYRVTATTATHPSWSPDGKRIVFVALAADTGHGRSDFGPIFILDLRTEHTRRLTRMLGNGPAWSHGGKRIAFAGRAEDGSVGIYLVNPDGSHLVKLVT
jgi:TolB protein